MAKTVLESKFTEWKGLDRISATVHEMKCFWRELTKDDFGIDGEIEIVVPKQDGKGYETLGNVLKVQAKSGDKYVRFDTETNFASPVEQADLEGWNKSRYPVLYIVYTMGYVPYLETYPGSYVPEPWEIIEHHGGSSPKELLREVLALTKMNVNNCSYADGRPITLSFSHKVGEVMKHIPAGESVEAGYKFYM
jgi:Domain of unknown function (DUF4365)